MSVTIRTDAEHIDYLRDQLSIMARQCENLEREIAEAKSSVENMASDCLRAENDRDQWCEVAERMAAYVETDGKDASAALAAFEKLKGSK